MNFPKQNQLMILIEKTLKTSNTPSFFMVGLIGVWAKAFGDPSFFTKEDIDLLTEAYTYYNK